MAVLWSIFLPPLISALTAAGGLLFHDFCAWLFLWVPKSKPECHTGASHARNLQTCDLEADTGDARTYEDNVLHFEPHSLTWRGIGLSVGSAKGTKEILRGCAGEVSPGEMAAIVGPSGAGKSTMLDVLAMRAKQTHGYVLVDADDRDAQFLKIATYVPQEESLIPTLTVWETLGFSASLRLPVSIRRQDRHQIMTQLLRDLGLFKVKNSRVGGLLPGGLHVRGISGGERRRLHICAGIVAAPSFIFLDEPTSGLDSNAALVLMNQMKRLAGRGRTLICSIHQPRPAIWDLFDKVEVLSEGRLLYFGAIGDAKTWFSTDLGFSYNASTDGTFSDWLLDTVSVTFKGAGARDAKGLRSLADVEAAALRFSETALPALPLKAAPQLASSREPGATGAASCNASVSHGIDGRKLLETYPTHFGNQLVCLMWRAGLSYIRNPADVAGRLLLACGMGSLAGLSFLFIDFGVNKVVSQVYALNYVVIFATLGPLAQLSFYVSDRKFYLSDVSAYLYRPSAFFLAHTLASMPVNIVTGLVLFLTMYGLAGFKYSASTVLTSCAAFALQALNGSQVLIFSCYLAPNQDMATVLASAYIVLNMLAAGFPIPLRDLVPPMRAISYVTHSRYALQILVREQWLGTGRQSLLTFFDFRVANNFNFIGLALIFLAQLMLTYGVLLRMAIQIRKRVR